MDLGAADRLFGVAGAIRVGDEVVVANAGNHEVLVLGAERTLVRSFGRKGDGPGEFRSLAWLGAAGGDSVFTYDRGHDRVSAVSPLADGRRRPLEQEVTAVTVHGTSH